MTIPKTLEISIWVGPRTDTWCGVLSDDPTPFKQVSVWRKSTRFSCCLFCGAPLAFTRYLPNPQTILYHCLSCGLGRAKVRNQTAKVNSYYYTGADTPTIFEFGEASPIIYRYKHKSHTYLIGHPQTLKTAVALPLTFTARFYQSSDQPNPFGNSWAELCEVLWNPPPSTVRLDPFTLLVKLPTFPGEVGSWDFERYARDIYHCPIALHTLLDEGLGTIGINVLTIQGIPLPSALRQQLRQHPLFQSKLNTALSGLVPIFGKSVHTRRILGVENLEV